MKIFIHFHWPLASDRSDIKQSTPRDQAEFVAPDPSNEPASGTTSSQSGATLSQSRPQRTRQPPNLLSYYSLGQPISSQARISNVSLPLPRQGFSYEGMNIQPQNSQSLHRDRLFTMRTLRYLWHRDHSDNTCLWARWDRIFKDQCQLCLIINFEKDLVRSDIHFVIHTGISYCCCFIVSFVETSR